MFFRTLIVVLLTLFFNLAAFAETAQKQINLKVGVVLALTGQANFWSDMALKGLTLAKEDLAKDGINVELVIEDSGTNPAGSVKAFNKLVSVDKVSAVIGNVWGYLTEPLAPLAQNNKIPLLTVSGLACSNPYVFSSEYLDELTAGYKELFSLRPDLKTSAVFNFDDPTWGHKQRDSWVKAANSNSVKIIAHQESAELQPDFRSIFPKMITNNPDVFFIAQEPIGSTKALREMSYKGLIIQASSVMEAVLSNKENVSLYDNIMLVDVNSSEDFVQRFTKRFSMPPVLEPQASYEMLLSVVKANQINPENLSDGMRKVKYSGIAGEVDFTKNCQGIRFNRALFKLKAGKQIKIEN